MTTEYTPSPRRFMRQEIEEYERQQQIVFPAKVLAWDAGANTVQLEPQFYEVWREGNERRREEIEDPQDAYIENVPVLFPRSGTWSITFPIETGSFGLVTCTKYSLEVWREAGGVSDPGDLQTYTMNGAVFHPVNLHPDDSTLSNVDTGVMVLGDGGGAQFVALANLVKAELDKIQTTFESIVVGSGGGGEVGTPYTAADVASATVKVTE